MGEIKNTRIRVNIAILFCRYNSMLFECQANQARSFLASFMNNGSEISGAGEEGVEDF